MHTLFHRLLLVSLLIVALAGCAEFEDKPLDSAGSASRIQARSLSSDELHALMQQVYGQTPAWPLRVWNIDQLTLAAMLYHPDLSIARAQTEVADAAIITAGQRPNPTLNVSPTWISNLAAGAAAPWIVGAALSVPIETAGKRGYRIEKSQHLSDAAHYRLIDSAWLVRARIRQALLEVFAAQEAERLVNRQLQIQQAMNARLEQQQRVGELSRLDIMRAHLALNQMQLNLRAAEKRCAESRVSLAAAMGLPVTALSDIQFDFTSFAQAPEYDRIPIAELRQIALTKRPDILAALADYDAGQSALQLEIANQYPNIQVNPGYTWDIGAHYWTLAASALQLPIFHQNQGSIAEADAKRHELATRFEALQTKVIGDIDRAHAGLSAIVSKWRDAQQQARLQQENLRSAERLLQAGETDQLALLATQLEVAVAERAQLDVLVETQLALNALEDTLRYPMSSSHSIDWLSAQASNREAMP